MKKYQGLRILSPSMNDSYSRAELYVAFENEVFAKSKEMDISMLRETLRHMDDRPDDEVAPRASWVWQRILQKLQEERKVFALGLTRRGFAILVAIMILLLAMTALAVVLLSPKQVVEAVAVPIAQSNDLNWRVDREYSSEELAELIRTCNENGIDMEENSQIMKAIHSNEGYDEEETVMAICRIAFDGPYGEWKISERNWFQSIVEQLGYGNASYEDEPGPVDLMEEDARDILFHAIGDITNQNLPLNDHQGLYTFHLSYNADPDVNGAVWVMTYQDMQNDNREYIAALDRQGNVLSVTEVKHNYQRNDQNMAAFTLTEKDAVQLAAKGLQQSTGYDVPVTDEKQYHRFVMKKGLAGQIPVWDIHFNSNTLDWGHCEVLVNDATGETRIITADVGPLTADNIMVRYSAAYGWYGEWSQERWVQLSNNLQDLEAKTFDGRVLKATSYIHEDTGLLSRNEAEKAAYQASRIQNGDTSCAVLINALPNPIWKFRIIPYDESYPESIVIEIDAATGEVLDQEYYKSDNTDLCPSYQIYTLHRTWARMILDEKGAIPLAGLAVLFKYGDMTQDRPENELSIWNEKYWKPDVKGLTVCFVAQVDDLPDYMVQLNENGIPIYTEQKCDKSL